MENKSNIKTLKINNITTSTEAIGLSTNTRLKKRTNVKSSDRLTKWLSENNFLIQRFAQSDLMKFLKKCPISETKKKLTIHNTKFTPKSITLVLKENEKTCCFKLDKTDKGFLIKTTNELGWLFNNRGALINRVEHKKIRIWLEENGVLHNKAGATDLAKFIASCPSCKRNKPLRFHRSTENILDLQCGCINYFRIKKENSKFLFLQRGEILESFDINGKHL